MASLVNFYTAVLIVECRIDKDWFLADVYAVLDEHLVHCRDALHDCAFTVNHFDHRGVEPYSILYVVLYTAAVLYFADNAGCVYVACFKRVNVYFAVFVDELCAK